jgi:hypothetical protein
MKLARQFFVLVLVLTMSACNPKNLVLDPKAQAQAQEAYAQFVTGQDEVLITRMPPAANTPMQHKMIAALRELVPTTKADAATLVGWHSYAGTGGLTQEFVYRYDYGADHVTFATNFARSKDDAPWVLQGFNVQPSTPEQVSAPSQGEAGPIPPLKTKPAGS